MSTRNKTLVLIKPEGLQYRFHIYERLFQVGHIPVFACYESAPMDLMSKHYAEHRGTELHGWLMDYYRGKPLEVVVVEGDNIVSIVKELVGPSDPSIAPAGTLRSLSLDSLEVANKEKRPIFNIVHCSDREEEAQREIALWTKNWDYYNWCKRK